MLFVLRLIFVHSSDESKHYFLHYYLKFCTEVLQLEEKNKKWGDAKQCYGLFKEIQNFTTIEKKMLLKIYML